MSFSSDTKKELCRTQINSREEMTSECYGMLLYCKRFGADNIVFSTEVCIVCPDCVVARIQVNFQFGHPIFIA